MGSNVQLVIRVSIKRKKEQVPVIIVHGDDLPPTLVLTLAQSVTLDTLPQRLQQFNA